MEKFFNEVQRILQNVAIIAFFCCLCASCSSTRGIYIDECGDGRVREAFGSLKERERAVDIEERELNELIRKIEGSVGKENRIIRRIAELLQRIRAQQQKSDE